jgi:hypothetical protein
MLYKSYDVWVDNQLLFYEGELIVPPAPEIMYWSTNNTRSLDYYKLNGHIRNNGSPIGKNPGLHIARGFKIKFSNGYGLNKIPEDPTVRFDVRKYTTDPEDPIKLYKDPSPFNKYLKPIVIRN